MKIDTSRSVRAPRILACAVLALALAACNQTASAPPAPPAASAAPGVTPAGFKLPDGAGCAGDVSRFQAVLQNDVEIGHLTRAVYGRASQDVKQAEVACAAGRDVQARTILTVAKRNYGYP